MKTLCLIVSLLLPSLALAEGVTTPAANPPQAITLLGVSSIPLIKAPSGSIGNNGAVSGLTALPKTYSTGAYLYLPAGAIAAGVPAAPAWYWYVASSTTAGTVYNCTYPATGVPQPCTATAFSTTGPGAFTGTTGALTFVSITVPSNLMGRQGRLKVEFSFSFNNTAGNKINAIGFGAGSCFTNTNTTQLSMIGNCFVTNVGTTGSQHVRSFYASAAGGVLTASTGADTSIDTTANVAATLTSNVAVATDYSIVESFDMTVLSQN